MSLKNPCLDLLSFKLIAFDFDGVLADSEAIHYAAWKAFAASRGYRFDLSLNDYFRYVHTSGGNALHQYFLQDDPKIVLEWQTARKEKSALYTEMVHSGPVSLMPYVPELLDFLLGKDIPICVVTNSFKGDTDLIKEKQPLLHRIPTWFTRECHPKPKPSPLSYINALSHFSHLAPKEVLGIEDTLSGLNALQGAGITPVWLCDANYPYLTPLENVTHITSLNHLIPS